MLYQLIEISTFSEQSANALNYTSWIQLICKQVNGMSRGSLVLETGKHNFMFAQLWSYDINLLNLHQPPSTSIHRPQPMQFRREALLFRGQM